MAYPTADFTKPDATAQTLTQMGQSERDNMRVLRDACLMGGGFYGWNMSVSGGTAEEPAEIRYTKGTERVKAVLTWSGGNVTQAVYSYTADHTAGPPVWETIGTKTITYDGSDNVTSTNWT